MKFTTSLFSQILQIVPRNSFLLLVHQCGAERHAKGFSSWDQYVAMLFCQLAQTKSLREISDGLAVTCGASSSSAGAACRPVIWRRLWASSRQKASIFSCSVNERFGIRCSDCKVESYLCDTLSSS